MKTSKQKMGRKTQGHDITEHTNQSVHFKNILFHMFLSKALFKETIRVELRVVTKTWNDLKPPKTIYNHLKPPTTTSKNSTTTYNHLQPPQKHLQRLANNLKQSKSRYKCLKKGETTTCHEHEIRESNKTSTSP